MNKKYLLKVAKKIKQIRKEKGLVQDDIGVNGISRSMVGHIENARSDATITSLKIMADNMGVKVKDFFSFE